MYDPHYFINGLLQHIFSFSNDITRYATNGHGAYAFAGAPGHVTIADNSGTAHYVVDQPGTNLAIFSNHIGNGFGASAVAGSSGFGLRNTPPRVTTFVAAPVQGVHSMHFTPTGVSAVAAGSSVAGSDPSIRFRPSGVSAVGAASSSPSGTRFVSTGTANNRGLATGVTAVGAGSSVAGSDPSLRFRPAGVSAVASSSPSGTRFVSTGTGTNQGTRFAFASASSSASSP